MLSWTFCHGQTHEHIARHEPDTALPGANILAADFGLPSLLNREKLSSQPHQTGIKTTELDPEMNTIVLIFALTKHFLRKGKQFKRKEEAIP